MPFPLIDGNPAACLHILKAPSRESAVTLKFIHGIEYIVFFHIGKTLIYQGADHFNHPVDMFRCPGFKIRFHHPELFHILVKGVNVFLGQCPGLHPQLLRSFDDFIIDIGEVSNIGDIPTLSTQVPGKDIKDDGRPGVSNVAKVIDRDAAYIHPHFPVMQGQEGLLATCGGIIQCKSHKKSPKMLTTITLTVQ